MNFMKKVRYHARRALFKSWTDSWVRQIKQKVEFKVSGGREKEKSVIVDPSQTPSGKLAKFHWAART